MAEILQHPYFGGKLLYFRPQQVLLWYMDGGFQVWWIGIDLKDPHAFLEECARGEHIDLGCGTMCISFHEALSQIFD